MSEMERLYNFSGDSNGNSSSSTEYSSESENLTAIVCLDEPTDQLNVALLSSESSSDSDSSQLCYICRCKMKSNEKYAMMNHDSETHKYHIDCLSGWFKVNDYGIISREEVSSFSIYKNDGTLIKSKEVEPKKSEEEEQRALDETTRFIMTLVTFITVTFLTVTISVLFGVNAISWEIYIVIMSMTFLFFFFIPLLAIKVFKIC